MKKLLYLLLIAIVCSCSQDESIIEETKKEGTGKLKSQLHKNYRELGWGIDIMSDYLSLDAATAPVIDVDKFEKAFKSRIISKENQKYSFLGSFYGHNSFEYTRDLSKKAGAGFGTPNDKGIYPNTITTEYRDKTSYAASFSIVGYDKYVEVGKTYFVESDPVVLRDFLDAGFLYSLHTNIDKNPKKIIEEYGTHTLLDITVGGKLSLIYKSEIHKTNREKTSKAGASFSAKKFGMNFDEDSNDSLVQNNTNATLRAKSSGGTNVIEMSWDFKNGEMKDVSTTAWENSVQFDNSTIMKIHKVMPLYELVADPTKRNKLKAAIDDYINKSQLELLHPLYEYQSPSKVLFYYSISFNAEIGANDPGGWSNSGVICYAYSKPIQGTVPLYKMKNHLSHHYYTTTPPCAVGQTVSGNWTNMNIECYVYQKQESGTIPLYCFKKNGLHRYSIVDYAWGGEYRDGITCYVHKY